MPEKFWGEQMTVPAHIDLQLTDEQRRQVRRIARVRGITVDAALKLVMDEGMRLVRLRELAGQPPLPSTARRH
ncbi:hypothetical protein GCM10010975_26720 [Comamonas phosphati]|nr:hypothetical protein GCM10010975_26720 [Comamonas phosphati]